MICETCASLKVGCWVRYRASAVASAIVRRSFKSFRVLLYPHRSTLPWSIVDLDESKRQGCVIAEPTHLHNGHRYVARSSADSFTCVDGLSCFYEGDCLHRPFDTKYGPQSRFVPRQATCGARHPWARTSKRPNVAVGGGFRVLHFSDPRATRASDKQPIFSLFFPSLKRILCLFFVSWRYYAQTWSCENGKWRYPPPLP